MLKWLFALLIALAILSLATPWLARLGAGRLPGDLGFRLRGREYAIPFASSVVLSQLAWGIASLLKASRGISTVFWAFAVNIAASTVRRASYNPRARECLEQQ